MNAGDCFWGDPKGKRNEHLWLVLNHPSAHGGKAVLLNFSTVGERPVMYSVPPGYHPDLKADSAVCYGDMIVKEVGWVEAGIKTGVFRKTSTMSAAKLAFLVDQAKTLRFVDRDILRLL